MTPDASVLLDTRVLLLTGKGGTGKTTLAAAIGGLLAAQGRRVCVAELDSQRPALTSIFGVVPVYEPVEVRKNLSICNVEWAGALDDWLADVVAMPRVVRLIARNRVVSVFLEATPGARDLMLLMRVLRLAGRFDHLVVDLPASGNAVAMLSVAVTARRLFDAGPIRRCAEELVALLTAKDTALALVALPEDMVVNETIETRHKVARDLLGMRVPLVFLNRSTPPTLTPDESSLLSALAALPHEGLAREVVAAGTWEEELENATRESLHRLVTEVDAPVLALPVLARGEGARRVVSQLAAALARASRGRAVLVGEVV